MHFDRHVVARVLRHTRERLALDLGEVDDRAELRGAGGDCGADSQARVGSQVGEGDHDRGVAARLHVDARAVVIAVEDVRGHADDRPVHRRVDVGAGHSPHVEGARSRPAAAAERVVAHAAGAAAEEAPSDAADEALVRLSADGVERERAVVGGVVADRGDAALGDRQLKAERALERNHLRPRRSRGQEPCSRRGRRRSDRVGAARPESCQEQGDERDRREQHKPRQSPLSACSGYFRPPPLHKRVPGGAWHARHGNRGCLGVQFENRFDLVRAEGERAVDGEIPVPGRGSKRYDPGGTMPRMAGSAAGAARIQIPRWIQRVGLPMLLLLLWVVAGAARHVVFLFLVAALIAFLLNPLVRGLTRVWIPRGLGVAIVYLTFAAIVIGAGAALGTVVINETKSSASRVDDDFTVAHGRPYETHAYRDVDRLQHWLSKHHLGGVKVQKQGHDLVNRIRKHDVSKYTGKVIDFVEGAAIGTIKFLFSLVLVIVVSIYMLLDMPRLARAVDRRFPPHPSSPPLLTRIERSLASYVRGQVLLSLIIGVSAGTGLWLLGTLGWAPGADRYAVLFGAWVAVTELIPYLGPWLGALPPFFYELVVHPISALWVFLLFLAIHQIEGHVVVPKVMGSALRLHPLLVIFGLLAGGELYGLPGALVALPLLAAGRAMWEFFGERVELESWEEGGVPPVDVELEEAPPPPAAASG